MTPAETLVWRNLPADAQAALAACPAPGYLLRPDGSVVAMVACPGLPPGFGWCPADTGEIVRVASARWGRSDGAHLWRTFDPWRADEPMRLGALRLLAAVWPS